MKGVRLRVPGKVMIAGEYAVLRGGHALAATINRYMTIEVNDNPSLGHWVITSDLWSEPSVVSDLRVPEENPLRRAVQAAARSNNLFGGTVSVRSELNVQHGIGSSSALRLGICAAMDLLKHGRDPTCTTGVGRRPLQQAWSLQTEAQGQASGYDLVTQNLGGLVEFRTDLNLDQWSPHWFKLPIDNLSSFVHVFVGGAGAPTTETMQTTSNWLESGHKSERLADLSEALVDSLLAQIRFPSSLHLKKLIDVVAAHRGLFGASPLFPTEIATVLANTPGHNTKWTWKTTGAGGEDALLVIGSLDAIAPAVRTLFDAGWRRLDAEFCDEGIAIDFLNDTSVDKPREVSHVRGLPR